MPRQFDGAFYFYIRMTYYEILNIPESASSTDIKSAYRKLAKVYHPDLNPSPEAAQKFIDLEEAYSCLIKSDSRSAYDRLLLMKRKGIYGTTVNRKYENDVERRRNKARKRATEHANMSFDQYKADEFLHGSLSALIIKTIFTILSGIFLFWLMYVLIFAIYGSIGAWQESSSRFIIGIIFIVLLIVMSYLYEPLADFIVKLFPNRKKSK